MFLLRHPTPLDVEAFLRASRDLPLSYAPIGLAARTPAGFSVDERVAIVGSGEPAYNRAAAALASWRHFELGWLTVFPAGASTEPDTVVAVCVHHVGFWSLNGCRIVSSIREARASGFVYGTLTNHAECGEEIFKVELRDDGAVAYTIRAVSRPRAALARIGYPFTRALQARFRRDSAAAVARAVATD